MEITPYEPERRQDFIDFNTAWILENFGFLEPADTEAFAHIEQDLARGAMIFFAVEDGQTLAACMSKPLQGGT